MADLSSPAGLSDQLAALVARGSASVVAVQGGGRVTSGIHWRPGVIVTAEEVLEGDEGITVAAGGKPVAATLAGRDPSTDVAVLRFQADGLPTAELGDAGTLRTGHLVLAIGREGDDPIASFGIVGLAGGAWHSLRGGAIDNRLRLDVVLSRTAEGGALVDMNGHMVGMTVLGPRRRVLAIPRSTIDRAVDQLLAKGRIARGFLGAGLHAVAAGKEDDGTTPRRGLLVVSLAAGGPALRAGLLVGDIIVAWNGKPVRRVREVMQWLGSDSVGSTVRLDILRGGTPTTLDFVVGEREAA